MADWAPVLVGVVLFVLLSPVLLFSLPGLHHDLHILIFFAAYTILIFAVDLHITSG